MEFHSINNSKKHVQVAKQILDSIGSGTYKVGDKLPPERVIASTMGVGRPSVREALVALSMIGVLDIRQGDGIYVQKRLKPFQKDLVIKSVGEIKESPFEAFEVREVLEELVIRLVDLTDKELLKNLEHATNGLAEMLERSDYRGFLEKNRQFHQVLAMATENTLLERLMGYLIEITKEKLWKEMSKSYLKRHLSKSFEIHNNIFLSLRNQDRRSAVKYTKKHFLLVRNYFRG